MNRCVEPELLDELPPDDPGAIRSRRDLRRLNALMRHASIVAGALAAAWDQRSPRRMVELGAGDGSFALGLARKLPLHSHGHTLEVALVDRRKIVTDATLHRFRELGWTCEVAQADVFDWLTRSKERAGDFLVANLFLHHFTETRLRKLLTLASGRANLFIACEPRRTAAVLTLSRMLGLIGCNWVTRHDAVASVRAGFVTRELTGLWPQDQGWQLRESEAGLFSHLFLATRTGSGT